MTNYNKKNTMPRKSTNISNNNNYNNNNNSNSSVSIGSTHHVCGTADEDGAGPGLVVEGLESVVGEHAELFVRVDDLLQHLAIILQNRLQHIALRLRVHLLHLLEDFRLLLFGHPAKPDRCTQKK